MVVRVLGIASVDRQIRPRKGVASDEWNLRGKRSWDGDRCKKPRRSLHLTVPQTDTGRQVEDTKAFEITIVKELGNLTP